MEINVYHNTHFMDYFFNQDILQPTKLYLAATVETNSMDKAFELTNNIDTPWPENTGVKATGLSRRSTSVGDVLEQDNKFFLVASIGFRELSVEEISKQTFYKG